MGVRFPRRSSLRGQRSPTIEPRPPIIGTIPTRTVSGTFRNARNQPSPGAHLIHNLRTSTIRVGWATGPSMLTPAYFSITNRSDTRQCLCDRKRHGVSPFLVYDNYCVSAPTGEPGLDATPCCVWPVCSRARIPADRIRPPGCFTRG